MSAAQYILLGWFAVVALAVVARIGKQRKPTTPADACLSLVLIAGLATLVVLA